MSTIDLIVLGMIKQAPKSAYDIEKEVKYRNISKWVKTSISSIYKKVIKLECKGYIKSTCIKEGKMPEKVVYSLTQSGELYLKELMNDISSSPVNVFLDFNAVIVNLSCFPKDEQLTFLDNIERNIVDLRKTIEENMQAKQHIPEIGKSVLLQQYTLSESLIKWIDSLKKVLGE